MAFKMKGPSLYSSSPMKLEGFSGGAKKSAKKIKRTEGKLKKKDLTEDKKPFSKPDGSVNIPVNPNAPKVKVPKNNTSIKGKTQFEVDTQGVRNAVGKTVRRHKQGTKNVKKLNKKVSENIKKVKDYFTKR